MSLLGRCYYRVCETRAGHRVVRDLVVGARRLGGLRRFHLPVEALALDHASTAELMRLWSRIHWSSRDGMMPPDQLLAVYRLAAECPVRGDVVELGAWVGLTTSYLATACIAHGEGRVYAVDTFEGMKEGGGRYTSIRRYGGNTLGAFTEQIRRAGVEDVVEPLVGRTQDMARMYPGGPIRLLLIDADHSYEGVRRDFELWSPHVRPGGIVVFHDYHMLGVSRFVDQEVRPRSEWESKPGLVAPKTMAFTRRAARRHVSPHSVAKFWRGGMRSPS
ncbi:MAG: class I SAM-dependent methyltransferase [Planctomycetes bacterium]|nr:class I SAM-dependent methyltransferase [Planctomycetota bacterium]